MKTFRRKQRLARAKITLHVENSQLPHIRFDSPKEMWDNLSLVHRSRGFGTLLTVRRQFFSLKKNPDQSMQAWIATVRDVAFRLEAADFEVKDLDLIIALTQGLPESYSSLVISLDSTPLHELSVDHIIIRLLNEEARQQGVAAATGRTPQLEVDFPAVMLARDGSSVGGRASAGPIRCFNCGGKGHISGDCPSPRQSHKGEKQHKEIAASGMEAESLYNGDLSC